MPSCALLCLQVHHRVDATPQNPGEGFAAKNQAQVESDSRLAHIRTEEGGEESLVLSVPRCSRIMCTFIAFCPSLVPDVAQALTVTDPCVPLDRPLAAFTPPLRGFHWADDVEELS